MSMHVRTSRAASHVSFSARHQYRYAAAARGTGENPLDGAILYYYLKSDTAGPMTLEVLDGASQVVAHFSGATRRRLPNHGSCAHYWLRPFQPVASGAGMHRFIWDLRSTTPASSPDAEMPISAIYKDTPMEAGAWMPAGKYRESSSPKMRFLHSTWLPALDAFRTCGLNPRMLERRQRLWGYCRISSCRRSGGSRLCG
jgi:hypothetical protein